MDTKLAVSARQFQEALTFRCGLWNVGGEGQFYAGAIGAGLTGILVGGPGWFLIPLEIIAGAACGVLWMFVGAASSAVHSCSPSGSNAAGDENHQ